MEEYIHQRLDLTGFHNRILEVRRSISDIVVGQEMAIDMLLTAVLADGHVLLEGVPGVAKTLLARLMAKLIDARFSRLQFTPDLMPSDVLGTSVFNMSRSEFEFHPGPVFSDIVLVDEINRAPAKTQAALFEVMEERQATVDGVTYPMEPLFTVFATQNPVEQEGTYRLPEAQLDRFLMKVVMWYPSPEKEVLVLKRHHQNAKLTSLDDVRPVLSKDDLLEFRQLMSSVVADDSLLQYIVNVVQLTRSSKAVYLGASPRAAVALLKASKAFALLQGRDFITPGDIKTVAPSVLQHRLMLTAEAEMEGYNASRLIDTFLQHVEVPK